MHPSGTTPPNTDNPKGRANSTLRDLDDALQSISRLQQMLARVQSMSRIGTWSRDLPDGELFWSDQTYLIHGFAPGHLDLTRTAVLDLVHPDDLDRVMRTFQHSIETGEPFTILYRIIRPDDQVRVVYAENFVLEGTDGRPARLNGAIRDVTQDNESDASMSVSSRIESILSLTTDENAHIQATSLHPSQESEELIGTSVFDLLASSDDVEKVAGAMDSVETDYMPRQVWGSWRIPSSSGQSIAHIRPRLEAGKLEGFQIDLDRPPSAADENRESKARANPEIANVASLQKALRQSRLENVTLVKDLEAVESQLLGASLRLTSILHEERRRIAMDLHDQAGGFLSSLHLALSDVPDNNAAGIERAHELLDALDSAIRRITRELKSSVLDQFGPAEAIEQIGRDLAGLGGLIWKADVSAIPADLDDTEGELIFQIAREAITNVVRHAKASSISVSSMAVPGGIALSIVDDGCGFELPESTPFDSIGLRSMHERALMLNGSLDITSAPGSGTSVRVVFPLSDSRSPRKVAAESIQSDFQVNRLE